MDGPSCDAVADRVLCINVECYIRSLVSAAGWLDASSLKLVCKHCKAPVGGAVASSARTGLCLPVVLHGFCYRWTGIAQCTLPMMSPTCKFNRKFLASLWVDDRVATAGRGNKMYAAVLGVEGQRSQRSLRRL
eukprot:GHRQ01032551.1.p1 GENE.GHRQ01032551.1~~GHRQ01032551.1.p1  ORF type:complete len:133 (-),score=3.87 GHRQ01032551.1:148-546(-)